MKKFSSYICKVNSTGCNISHNESRITLDCGIGSSINQSIEKGVSVPKWEHSRGTGAVKVIREAG